MPSFLIKKDGFTKSKNQRFKCKDCSKKFTFVKRCKAQDLYTSYLRDKKSLSILANDAKISISTIQRALKSIKIAESVKLNHIKEVILLIDATYWGRNFGVVLFKDALSKKFIWWRFINRKELLADYKQGFKWCLE